MHISFRCRICLFISVWNLPLGSGQRGEGDPIEPLSPPLSTPHHPTNDGLTIIFTTILDHIEQFHELDSYEHDTADPTGAAAPFAPLAGIFVDTGETTTHAGTDLEFRCSSLLSSFRRHLGTEDGAKFSASLNKCPDKS